MRPNQENLENLEDLNNLENLGRTQTFFVATVLNRSIIQYCTIKKGGCLSDEASISHWPSCITAAG